MPSAYGDQELDHWITLEVKKKVVLFPAVPLSTATRFGNHWAWECLSASWHLSPCHLSPGVPGLQELLSPSSSNLPGKIFIFFFSFILWLLIFGNFSCASASAYYYTSFGTISWVKYSRYGIPTTAKNFFITSAENIVTAFSCGSTGLGQIRSEDMN